MAYYFMAADVALSRQPDPVKQLSVFTANRLGRLHDVTALLGSHEVHVLALTVLDTTDSAIIRLVTDDPDRAREVLHQNEIPFTESETLVVDLYSATGPCNSM